MSSYRILTVVLFPYLTSVYYAYGLGGTASLFPRPLRYHDQNHWELILVLLIINFPFDFTKRSEMENILYRD